MRIHYAIFQVPLGWMGLVGGEKGIQRIYLPISNQGHVGEMVRREYPESQEESRFFLEEIQQFEEYFSRQRKEFSLSLDFSTATPFQRRVYEILLSIPFGEVRTYGWVAERLGSPKALRAVGNANAKNRWPLVVPCHRVVGSSGHLTGFSAAGGLNLKADLLKMEGIETKEGKISGFKGATRKTGAAFTPFPAPLLPLR